MLCIKRQKQVNLGPNLTANEPNLLSTLTKSNSLFANSLVTFANS
jgi:hypothetical protein